MRGTQASQRPAAKVVNRRILDTAVNILIAGGDKAARTGLVTNEAFSATYNYLKTTPEFQKLEEEYCRVVGQVQHSYDEWYKAHPRKVASACAILREAVSSTKQLDQPSAALIKAVLINGAVDIGRSHAEQGFGKVNLTQALLEVPITYKLEDETIVCGFTDGETLKQFEEW